MSENNSNPAYSVWVTLANALLPLAAGLNKAKAKGRAGFKCNFSEKCKDLSLYLRHPRQPLQSVFNKSNINIALQV